MMKQKTTQEKKKWTATSLLKNRTVVVLLWIMILCVSITGCSTTDQSEKEPKQSSDQNAENTVRIGVFEPLSGENADGGEAEKIGIELAHELCPQALGKDVELIYADNESDIDTAKKQAQSLVEKKPAVILGSYGNVYSLMANDIFAEAKIPAIAITCTNPLVTAGDYYFRVCYVESFQGIAAAKFAAENRGLKKAAIMKETGNDYAAAVTQAFREKFIALTNDEYAIISDTEYQAGDKKFDKQLEHIKQSGVEIVFLPAQVEDAANIMKEAQKLGLEVTFLGTDQWDDQKLLERAGDAAEGAVFLTDFAPDATASDTTKLFLEAYKKKYGEDAEPEGASALAFDAYYISIESINRAGTALNGQAIRDEIQKTKNFKGASGTITFDANGDPIKSVRIKTVQNGKFVFTDTVEPVWS